MQDASSTHIIIIKTQSYQSTVPTLVLARELSDTYLVWYVHAQGYHCLHETAVVQTVKVMALLYIRCCHLNCLNWIARTRCPCCRTRRTKTVHRLNSIFYGEYTIHAMTYCLRFKFNTLNNVSYGSLLEVRFTL